MMRYLSLIIIFLFIVLGSFAQKSERIISHDDTARKYIEYIPASYDGIKAYPVVFALHGLGDNMNNFYNIGMNNIADTAGFILIVPEALMATPNGYPLGNAWNSGASAMGVTPNQNVDDTGFLFSIVDSLNNNYTIDLNRIYFFGFSMGGYMSNKLACEKGDSIAAIASVSGTIGVSYTPGAIEPVASLHIHGTSDNVVPYQNNNSGIDADSLINFRISENNNDTSFFYYQYPDVSADNLKFKRYFYKGGDKATALIKVEGGAHEWYSQPANDVSYIKEIWRFFDNRFGYQSSGVKESLNVNNNLELYPNPAYNKLNIKFKNNFIPQKIKVLNAMGQVIKSYNPESKNETIDISGLQRGFYYVTSDNTRLVKKLIVN